jgi:hypothetical protein
MFQFKTILHPQLRKLLEEWYKNTPIVSKVPKEMFLWTIFQGAFKGALE